MMVKEKKTLVIGSRASKLAVVQSEIVIDYLKKTCPDVDISLATMSTKGDRILDRRLDLIGGKGLFVQELESAMRAGETDYSVHSLKDMPMEMPADLPIVCYSNREDPRDVLVLPEGKPEIDFSKPIGTSSARRVLQLQNIYPNARFESIRGNLQTRLKKLDDGQFGAIILAAAGLKRMGLEYRISRYFSVKEVIPAAGQGILAVQGRADSETHLFDGFQDPSGTAAAICERAFVRTLNGGCSSPIAAHAIVENGGITLLGLYVPQGTDRICRSQLSGPMEQAEKIGMSLARIMLEQEGKES